MIKIIKYSYLYIKTLIMSLNVPIDRSDFPDFYTMKSLHVGDFGVKIKKF
jgi:hypothetical protein